MSDWKRWLTEAERTDAAAKDAWFLARSLAASRALVAALKEAGVTDYGKLGSGSHRVDCHFCKGVWTSGQEPKHRPRCPLALKEEEMLDA